MDIGDDFGREPNTKDLRLLVASLPLAGQTALPASNDSLKPKLNVVPQPGKSYSLETVKLIYEY